MLRTPAIEREHVHEVYDTIAGHWDRTRHKPWPRVQEFIQRQPRHGIIGDIGCGNGVNRMREGGGATFGPVLTL